MPENIDRFLTAMKEGYLFKGPSVIMGSGMLEGEVMTHQFVRIPLKTLNRHGLIAGATGTGKTKTLQILAEQLSANGVPTLLMDIKGDLSGIAVKAESNSRIDERHDKIGFPFIPDDSPVEFLSLSDDAGLQLKATVSEFGPVLFSRILELNDTQSGIIAILFKYCDDHEMPLLDLDDIKKVLRYMTNEGKEELEIEYGRISSASVNTIIRKIIELEQQGADKFFGEVSFDVNDLCRIKNGKGMISILRLTDIQDKPKLFSTFMLQMLAEIYSTFPEIGDQEKPKLVLFIEEAHLIFNKASSALLDQMEMIIKLIRSKGVGIIFVTQNPIDIPNSVLSQLGLKIQHALRAFTAKDRQAIRMAAQNYPITPFYDTAQLLTEMGIGEAFITALNEKGIPTPLVHTYLRAPQSRMDVLHPEEIQTILKQSSIASHYNKKVNRESAYDILTEKIKSAHTREKQEELQRQQDLGRRTVGKRNQKSELEKFLQSTTARQIGRTVAREFTRGLMGILGGKKR